MRYVIGTILLLIAAVPRPTNARSLKSWFRNKKPATKAATSSHKFVIPSQREPSAGHTTVIDGNADALPLLSVWVARSRWSIAKEVSEYSNQLGTSDRKCPVGATTTGTQAIFKPRECE